MQAGPGIYTQEHSFEIFLPRKQYTRGYVVQAVAMLEAQRLFKAYGFDVVPVGLRAVDEWSVKAGCLTHDDYPCEVTLLRRFIPVGMAQ